MTPIASFETAALLDFFAHTTSGESETQNGSGNVSNVTVNAGAVLAYRKAAAQRATVDEAAELAEDTEAYISEDEDEEYLPLDEPGRLLRPMFQYGGKTVRMAELKPGQCRACGWTPNEHYATHRCVFGGQQ